ncbi:MAG TPA: LptA/OstA family protein, partial [Bdellovibrionota bacterium]|nr:LptA/OstA family protein [Bdellovibrionota bacterium]
MRLRQPSRRQVLLALAGAAVTAQILLLSPSSLEHPGGPLGERPLRRDDLRRLIVPNGEALAPGIPEDKVPNYNVEDFHYLSSSGGKRQWKILAARAHMYTQENLVHASSTQAYLYSDGAAPADPQGRPPAPRPGVSADDQNAVIITAREAKYSTNSKELEMYGQVMTSFPDGLTLRSEYMRYDSATRALHVPTDYPVAGESSPGDGKLVRFKSRGMDFPLQSSAIILPETVEFEMSRLDGTSGQTARVKSKGKQAGIPDTTRILADRCEIYREERRAHFSMRPERPASERFVRVAQPRLHLQSREVTLFYQELDRRLKYMNASQDVAIKEEGDEGDPIRYATAGQADFDTQVNRIFLSQLPQVYQDNDTVTGEVVTIYRDTDIVEVEQ